MRTSPGGRTRRICTLRDAIAAALNFHIFQRHADRVLLHRDLAPLEGRLGEEHRDDSLLHVGELHRQGVHGHDAQASRVDPAVSEKDTIRCGTPRAAAVSASVRPPK